MNEFLSHGNKPLVKIHDTTSYRLDNLISLPSSEKDFFSAPSTPTGHAVA
jgi:hypothetical protein